MERNVQKNGLVNLVAAVVIFIAAFVVTCLREFAGGAGLLDLPRPRRAGGVRRAGSRCGWRKTSGWKSWKSRNSPAPGANPRCLNRRRRRFSRRGARASSSRNFSCRASACCCSCSKRSARGCSGAGLARTTNGIVPDRAMPSLSLFGIFALLLFLLGRFSVTIARLENHRLLRPGANFLLAGAYICFVTALGIAGVEAKFPRADFYLARGVVRAARRDGGGNARHPAAGNLPARA